MSAARIATTSSRAPRPVLSPGRRRAGRSGALLAGASLLLAACTVGPAYVRPSVAVPGAFRSDPNATPTVASIADVPWWNVFGDPMLRDLVAEAVANNQDVAAAAARVEEACARAGIARADGLPQVELDANATRNRSSLALGFPPFGPRVTNDFRATIGATWELDLWGRIRRGEEAAIADYFASEEGRRAVIVTLVGDVGEAYLDLRELDQELEITKRTVGAWQKTHDLFAKRFEAGTASKLETAQATADLAAVTAAVPTLEKLVVQQENRLSLLLGRPPSEIRRGPTLNTALPPITAGLPCALLERRPDVLAAEASVRAAIARIGVADAELFPKVSLSAFFGSDSADISDVATERAGIASFGAGLVAPIFNGGRLRASRRLACATWEEAVALYRKAVQDALRDVSDQLIAITKTEAARVELEKVVSSLSEALGYVNLRYDSGASTYFEVLDSQRRLLPAELDLARTKRDRLVAFVRLYRALGGSFVCR